MKVFPRRYFCISSKILLYLQGDTFVFSRKYFCIYTSLRFRCKLYGKAAPGSGMKMKYRL